MHTDDDIKEVFFPGNHGDVVSAPQRCVFIAVQVHILEWERNHDLIRKTGCMTSYKLLD